VLEEVKRVVRDGRLGRFGETVEGREGFGHPDGQSIRARWYVDA